MQQPSKVDLTTCDLEPIHIPGAIQNNGFLIATDAGLTRIVRHSANAAEFLGDVNVNGRMLVDFLEPDTIHELRNTLSRTAGTQRPAFILAKSIGEPARNYDVAAHATSDGAIIEFEPSASESQSPLELTRILLERIMQSQSVEAAAKSAARAVRAMLGYDRVMVYRFAHDGAGQVIEESKSGEHESFLGQWFPASDIPQQARVLYVKNTIRVIADVDGLRVPIVPEIDASGEPLDLSFAQLRSVSPIHCEYLRNMGVSASMSISILVGGELWGLIACHHYSPRALPMPLRIASEMFGQYFSLHLEVLTHRARLDVWRQAQAALEALLRDARQYSKFEVMLADRMDVLAHLIDCDGLGVWLDGTWRSSGIVPPAQEIPQLAKIAGANAGLHIWATHRLGSILAGATDYSADVSGILAIPLSQAPRDYLFYFRREVVRTVEWAGNPHKVNETGPLGERLTPRKSFSIWKEAVEGQSSPWSDIDQQIGEAIRTTLLELSLRQSEFLETDRNKV